MDRPQNSYWAGNKGKAAGDEKQNKTVETVSNHIYFYNGIDDDTTLNLNKTIRSTTNTLRKQMMDLDIVNVNDVLRIYLHINSVGGYLFDAFSVLDTIINNPIPIVTVVEGVAASGATIFSVAGSERWILRHSYMMIHQLSASFWGKYEEIDDQKKNIDSYMVMIKKIYKEYTKIPMSKLDEILKHDLYFDAEQCQEYGLVDKII